MPSNAKDKDLLLNIAKDVLTQTRKQFPLGSANIKPVVFDKYSDKISFTPGLFANKLSAQSRSIDALINEKLSEVAARHIDIARINLTQRLTKLSSLTMEKIIELRTIQAREAARLGAGNCSELTMYAFLQLIENGYDGKIEYACFVRGDHDFLVINRPANSNKSNWKTWGTETIILDPWLNKAFHANKLGEVWKKNLWRLDKKELLTTDIKFNEKEYKNLNH